MKQESWIMLCLAFALLIECSSQMDVLNKGIVFPCSTVLAATNKFYVLYGLELDRDINKTFTIPGRNAIVTVQMNFCKKIGQSHLDIDRQSFGSPLMVVNGTQKPYAISYFDGYLNSTDWKIVHESVPVAGNSSIDAIKIAGTNKWAGQKSSLIDTNFTILCNQDITSAEKFLDTLTMTSFNEKDKIATFVAQSKVACGHHIPISLNVPWIATVWLAGLVGLVLVCYGFKVLRTSLVVIMFLLGIGIGVGEILENSSVMQWTWISFTFFGIVALLMGFILSYSAFFLPTGAIYVLALYVGYSLAAAICDKFDIKSRLYSGYLFIHAVFLAGSLLLFKINLNNCKFAFTAALGACLLMIAYSNYRYPDQGLSFSDFQLDRLGKTFKQYTFTLILAVVFAILGFRAQKEMHSRAGDENNANGIEEILDQQ